MESIIRYVLNMVPYMIAMLPILVAVRISIKLPIIKEGKKLNIVHEIGVIIFILYLVGLASQTIIPKFELGRNSIEIVGRIGFDYNRINTIPFNKIKEVLSLVRLGNFNYLWIEVLGNIGVFSVIGFMLPLLWTKLENIKTVLLCFSISVCIETVQLILPRATDVDDLIMNTLGGLIGYIGYMIFKRLFPKSTSKFKGESEL